MDSAPGRAQGGDVLGQLGFDLRQFARLETDRFAQGGRTGRIVQIENGFAVAADDVNVRWPVIVRIDHHAIGGESVDGRHDPSYKTQTIKYTPDGPNPPQRVRADRSTPTLPMWNFTILAPYQHWGMT